MCGIFGFWLNRPLNDGDLEAGRRATRRLSHRGPDGEGFFADAERGLFLGHRRLSILDLNDRAAQPMRRGNRDLCYNGEIYNYLELRSELEETGEVFETECDTEVLLSALNRWGTSALTKLDGMFAAAAFDGNSLQLICDPFGEKPLYLARTPEGVYFSSEPNVLIDILGLAFSPDEDELYTFLALGFIPPPATGYKGLEVVSPATVLTFDTALTFKEERYWQPPIGEANAGTQLSDAFLDDLTDLLLVSIKRRMRADVPIGVFLSSGIDSSLIAALAVKELNEDITGYTVAFPSGADESDVAAAIASVLGMEHKIIAGEKQRRSDGNIVSGLADMYGVPNDNLTALSVHEMSRVAGKHITVALAGTGGDELAYGYNKYRFLAENRWAYRVPEAAFSALKPLAPILDRLPRWQNIRHYLEGNRTWRITAVKNGLAARPFSDHFKRLNLQAFLRPEYPVSIDMRSFDLRATMPGSYLPSVDRGSMRASLEVRSPFLSTSLFEKMAELNQSKLLLLGRKIALRRLLSRYLPQEIVDRKKQGFVYPVARWSAGLEKPPRPDGISPKAADELWEQKQTANAGIMLLRLALIEEFQNRTRPEGWIRQKGQVALSC